MKYSCIELKVLHGDDDSKNTGVERHWHSSLALPMLYCTGCSMFSGKMGHLIFNHFCLLRSLFQSSGTCSSCQWKSLQTARNDFANRTRKEQVQEEAAQKKVKNNADSACSENVHQILLPDFQRFVSLSLIFQKKSFSSVLLNICCSVTIMVASMKDGQQLQL